jgi:hypothetical protein
MKLRKIFSEPVLYLIALAIAFSVRFVNLAHIPLTDYEASWALQALDSIRGSHPVIGAQVAYVQLTSLLFFIFSPTNLLARFIPALLGSLMVLVAFFSRDMIGRRAAVILAFALALDPGLTAISRQAGEGMLAVAGAWLAICFWLKKKPVLAGIFLTLAFMGGETFWQGLVALAITFGLARVIHLPRITLFLGENSPDAPFEPGRKTRNLLISAAATVLLVGSLCMVVPSGLGALFAGLVNFLGGWVKSSGVSVLQPLVALPVYQPLGVLLVIIGFIRTRRSAEPLDKFLGLWVFAALLLVLIYPSRQVGDLCWVLVPLLILAARESDRLLSISAESKLPAMGLALLTLIISMYVWTNLAAISKEMQTSAGSGRWVAILIGLFICVVAAFLAAWGWSGEAARKGSIWGISAALAIYTVFAMTHAAHLRPQVSSELWDRDHLIPRADLLLRTLDTLSDRHVGLRGSLDIAVVNIDSPALRWLLRSYVKLSFTDQLAIQSQPAVVITRQEDQPELAVSYRGESFPWYGYTDWSLLINSEYFPWLIQRKSPEQVSTFVVWARTDIFPDSQNLTQGESQP